MTALEPLSPNDDLMIREHASTGRAQTICLVIASLSGGGAERAMVMLAEWLSLRGWRIVLITLDSPDSDFFTLPAGIVRRALGVMKPSASLAAAAISNTHRLVALRRAIRREDPAAVISFVDRTNVLTLVATAGLPYPIIVSERTNPQRYEPGRIWRLLRRLSYPRSAAVVVQTQSVRPWAELVARGATVEVIPNAPSVAPRVGSTAVRKQWILGVGRLSAEKGFDVLIDAFARLAPDFPDWNLLLVGDGPLRATLRERASAAGLGDRIVFTGLRHDVHELLAQAEIYVLASRFEGFPNALIEAMALGCAVVACACDSGPADIIRHETDGLLISVDDAPAMADALRRLINSPQERARLQRNAVDVRDRFSPQIVFGAWEALVLSQTHRASAAPRAAHRSAS